MAPAPKEKKINLSRWRPLGLFALVGAASLGLSWWSYLKSGSRQAVQVAQVEDLAALQDNNPYELVFTQGGEVVISYFSLAGDYKVNAKVPRRVVNGRESKEADQLFRLVLNQNGFKSTGWTAVKGQALGYILVTEQGSNGNTRQAFGWRVPQQGKCGWGEGVTKVDVSDKLKAIRDRGETIIKAQCWENFEDKDGEPEDFVLTGHDFLMVVSVKSGGASPSPSPDPDPSADPSPSPDPDGGHPRFWVRKYEDKDGDGTRDDGEDSPGAAWDFQYRVNDGEWQDYQTDAATGLGPLISVATGDKVEVEEVTKKGWTLTSANNQVKTLNENRIYGFGFGNKKQSFPPQQPDTGTPTWLTLGLLAAAAGFTLVKLAKLLAHVR